MILIKFGLVDPNPYPTMGGFNVHLRRFGLVDPNPYTRVGGF